MDPARRKILLIYPKTGQDVFGFNVGLPIGLLGLATALERAGYHVESLDERGVANIEVEVRRAARADLLFGGISAMTGFQIRGGLRAAAILRELQPDRPIVWGGVHPTLVSETTIRHPLVDLICLGDGEETIVELAASLSAGRGVEAVPGLVFKRGDEVRRTPDRPLLSDLDRLPRLNYDLVNVDDYKTIGHLLRETQLQLCTSRGCVHRCGYCYNLLFNQRKYRCMSAERTFEEIRLLHEQFGVRSIFFYDDYFFAQAGRVRRLLELIEENGLRVSFEVSCRIDFLDRLDLAFLQRLRRAGFLELLIGVESGNDEILRRIQKDFTVEQVLAVNQKLAQAGIQAKYSFMAGFPGETEPQVLDTVNLMRRLLRENPHASVTPLGIYTPYPGTALYEECLAAGLANFPQTLDEWADYNWVEARHSFLSPKQMLFLNRLNVMSRFFDLRAVERFGSPLLRPLLRTGLSLYRCWNEFRLKFRFFGLMWEVPLVNRLQQLYVEKTNRLLLRSRPEAGGGKAGLTRSGP